ncbi:ComEC family competence protein [Caproiciproducens sp. NJN-50]|uniref:ComEC/Rec2 family competence protein n=1 Tax=Acutalibacteraceae TaxID=3082771 RepID=UPI000FFE0FFB|nr:MULTISPECIES: ComEC/Rec2 family competence protein [Acutalibacteraceae]QAT49579.1 ComEC family competence protein [Caproiciproducens sp. NJN-50]
MRRPLVLVGFCYLLTLAAAVYLGAENSYYLFWCCIAFFALSVSIRKMREVMVFPAAFLTAAVAFGCFAGYSRAAVEPPRVLDGADAEVKGTVCELPYSQYGRWYYVVRLDSVSVPGTPQKFKIRLSSQNELSVGPYSRISCKVHFFRPQGGEGYSSESYYESRGIRMFAYLSGPGRVSVMPPGSKPPYYYALLLRQAMISSVDSMLPQQEASSLIRGMLLGDKTSLGTETEEDFRSAGVSHLLAVSGLHMATIAQLLFLLFGLLRIPKRRSAPIAGAGILCFMAVTGFVPSVVRSGIMCLLCLAAPLMSRRADPLNSLGAAVLILCLPNPYAAADVGLLLSFSATLGLILFAGPIQNWLDGRLDRLRPLRRLTRGIDGILATSAAAIVSTLPVMILSFGSVSLIAPISNLLMLVPASLMISLSAVGAVIGLFAPQSFLLMPFALSGGLLSKYLLTCAKLLARVPFASVSASYGYIFLWLAGSILLFAAAFSAHGGRRLTLTAGILSAVMLVTGILSYGIISRGVTRIAALDVGTGLSVAVTENGHSAVFGCGGYNSNNIKKYLSGRNIRSLDELCLLTKDHEEDVNSADLTKRISADHLSMPEGSRYDGFVQEAAAGSRSDFLKEDASSEQAWQNIEIQKRSCNGGIAVRMKVQNVSVLLLPAEADASALPESWLSPDFLITDMLPGEAAGLHPLCTILSMDEQDLCKLPAQNGNHTFWTGGFGTVVLELRGDRILSVGRES